MILQMTLQDSHIHMNNFSEGNKFDSFSNVFTSAFFKPTVWVKLGSVS